MYPVVPSRYLATGSRYAPIRIDQPFMRGEAHFVLPMPESLDTDQVTSLISSSQLTVSRRGLEAVILQPDAHGLILAHHTDLGELGLPFESTDLCGNVFHPQILRVRQDSVLVYGRVKGDRQAGVWHLSPYQTFKLVNLDRLTAMSPSGDRMVLVGQQDLKQLLVTEQGLLPLEASAKVTVTHDGSVLILEQYPDHPFLYTYRFTHGQMESFTNAPCGAGEVPVQLLVWGDRLFLAVRGQEHSFLREFGSLIGNSETEVEGLIEMAWSGPRGNSIAFLSRVRWRPGWQRQLYLNMELVYEGSFTMEQGGLYWSDNGQTFAAVIHEEDGQEVVLTPNSHRVIPRGEHVRDLLVGSQGSIDAIILYNGQFDTPFVGQRPHDWVPHAWNLHRTPDGSVAYNAIHGSHVMCWVDWTERF